MTSLANTPAVNAPAAAASAVGRSGVRSGVRPCRASSRAEKATITPATMNGRGQARQKIAVAVKYTRKCSTCQCSPVRICMFAGISEATTAAIRIMTPPATPIHFENLMPNHRPVANLRGRQHWATWFETLLRPLLTMRSSLLILRRARSVPVSKDEAPNAKTTAPAIEPRCCDGTCRDRSAQGRRAGRERRCRACRRSWRRSRVRSGRAGGGR